ncbi:MAG: large subunit ribosomal protein L23 [Candidatus Saccharimonadales bacterium]|jgi:large subunit ribosomal protein L23
MSAITLKPRMSEKSYAMSDTGVYVFDIDPRYNKHEISDAIQSTYEVTVVNIRTITVKGKVKRLYRNRRYETGSRATYKKAYVTLKEGDAIPIFAAVEEQQEKADKTAKLVEKSAEKKAKKEKKDK